MVTPNVQNRQIRKRRVQAQQQLAGARFQGIMYSVLWQMIRDGCPDLEEGQVPCLSVPRSDLAKIPKNFALNLGYDEKTDIFTIKSILVKPKSNILLADGSPADG